ncbi:MAG: hypothetical protein RR141_05510 [Rikenellaceae bacterium]
MEKIFKDCRLPVADSGFSDRVIHRIVEIAPVPSRNIYITPTFITALSAIIIIIVLTQTIGLSTLNDRYEHLTDLIVYHDDGISDTYEPY